MDYVREISPGLPVAVIEAKRAYRDAADGLQQAIRYAQQLDVALAYATNGSVIIERDMVSGQEHRVDSVRTPAELWSRYCDSHGLDTDQAAALQQPFNRNRRDASGAVILPRYYQTVAVHRALRAASTKRVVHIVAADETETGSQEDPQKNSAAPRLASVLHRRGWRVGPGSVGGGGWGRERRRWRWPPLTVPVVGHPEPQRSSGPAQSALLAATTGIGACLPLLRSAAAGFHDLARIPRQPPLTCPARPQIPGS